MAYQFHAWARKSIASLITSPDDLGSGSGLADVRVRIPLEVEVSGKAITKQFSVAGPGDIIGIRQEMIVRTDPRPNSGDFEPNYFPSIEFYDEDFPWRYTPAAPVGENLCQLRPWLMLLVLTEDEFTKNDRSAPLNSIVIKSAASLPTQTELHLWAHVHSNFGDPDTPLEDLIGSLREKSEMDPDGLFSRIMCPRKLQPDVLYHAFLVPVFEAGRLAGLGLPSDQTPAQQAAWNETSAELELPVYYRWQFRTGAKVDFETLLRMMEPRPTLDPKVGIQELECSNPAYIRVGQEGEVPAPTPAVLGMCGAVKQLSTIPSALENPVAGQAFVQEIKKHLDLVVQAENLQQDPVVTIPFYGYHHAKTREDETPDFLPDQKGWPHVLNLDPRNRAAAGLGTLVVQRHQEKFMQNAWTQLPRINEINRKIKSFKLVMEVNERLLQSTFAKEASAAGAMLAMIRPVAARVKEASVSKTMFQTISESQVPNASLSSSFRRLSRPNGSISKKLNKASAFSFEGVFNKVNQVKTVVPTQGAQVKWFSKGLQTEASTTGIAVPMTKAITRAPLAATKFTPGKEVHLAERFTGATKAVLEADETAAFAKTEEILSIDIPEPVSTTTIPAAFQNTVLNNLSPVNTLLPGFRARIVGLPKPPETAREVMPVMAHPDFPEPTYKHLANIDPDFIVPNLSLVPPNTIALMKPNFEFIHSFLVGVNHEMSRELLWREYPTDQRGTYFRQFWDPGGDQEAGQAGMPKDIKRITDWGNATTLDSFSEIATAIPREPLVLLLKGDLLKKYPNIVVFAQKARLEGSKLVLDSSSVSDSFKFPLFSGKLEPDVRLLGFDLTVAEARGKIPSDGTSPTGTDLGWFFVLAEVPGEARFGADITYAAPGNGEKNTWDNLSLEDLNAAEAFIREKSLPLPLHGKWPNDGSDETLNMDLEKWGRSSADMAGILFQKPAMMAIHGDELLKAFKI